MDFIIRRRVRTDERSGCGEYREIEIPGKRITIGRSPDQDLQIADPSVKPHHAWLESRGRGRLYVRALKSADLELNGEACRFSPLSPGDSIRVGPAVISVEKSGPDSAIVAVEYGGGQGGDLLSALHATSLSQTRLSKRSWSWVLVFGVATVCLLIPLSGLLYAPLRQTLRDHLLIPDDNLWSSGPLHRSHQFIGKDCNVCHKTPFKMVRNQECTECHADIQHHVDVRSSDVRLFEVDRCATCHREHNEPDILVQRDPRLCTDCHQKLDQLRSDSELENVTDFSDDHPDFRLTILTPNRENGATHWRPVRVSDSAENALSEPSVLTFSHKDHLNPEGIESPDGDQILVCQDCHKPVTSGRYMMPIVMESRCSRCHRLQFDENDPDSLVPHGSLQKVHEALKEHFSHQYLQPTGQASLESAGLNARRPGRKAKILSREEQKRALDWVDRQALLITEELLEDRVCSDCHQVSKIPGKTGFEQWYLEPIALTRKWMPLALFDHARHDTEPCTTCHKNAEKSEKSSDVLMPGIATCRECHGGVKETEKIPSDCLMCHPFHLPDRGLFDPALRKVAERSPSHPVSGRLKRNDGNL